MTGSLVARSKKEPCRHWALVLNLGRRPDPVTGLLKVKQQWVSFKGTKREAKEELHNLLTKAKAGELVKPSKLTFGAYLLDWLQRIVKPTARPNTHACYANAAKLHVGPALGHVLLQQVSPLDLQSLYATLAAKQLAPGTVKVMHAAVSSCLQAAMDEGLIASNPAKRVRMKPKGQRDSGDILERCWTADEAARVVAAAKLEDVQTAALIALALDSGMRRGELLGLGWSAVDLDAGRVQVVRQLDNGDGAPVFGPTKTRKARVVDLGRETVELLRAHRQAQNVTMMANRTTFEDHGLVFSRTPALLWKADDKLGLALRKQSPVTLFERVIKTAGVRAVTFHGTRHTCASLLLASGVPVNVVSARLGHKNVAETLRTYSHVLPGAQQEAAAQLGALLHANR